MFGHKEAGFGEMVTRLGRRTVKKPQAAAGVYENFRPGRPVRIPTEMYFAGAPLFRGLR